MNRAPGSASRESTPWGSADGANGATAAAPVVVSVAFNIQGAQRDKTYCSLSAIWSTVASMPPPPTQGAQ